MKILVEMKERDGIWWYDDENGAEWSTTMGTGLKPKEASDKNNLKTIFLLSNSLYPLFTNSSNSSFACTISNSSAISP